MQFMYIHAHTYMHTYARTYVHPCGMHTYTYLCAPMCLYSGPAEAPVGDTGPGLGASVYELRLGVELKSGALVECFLQPFETN